MGRRRRVVHRGGGRSSSEDSEGSSSKENEEDQKPAAEEDHPFLQLHPPEREQSPSPAHSPATPPLDLSTLHQQVDCSEPLTSRGNWSFAHRQPEVSPRNSLVLTRPHLDPNVPPSPPQEHDVRGPQGECEERARQMGRQVHSLKKKLRRFEEEFERENGYRPSHADKMSSKEVKKWCSELNRLRKEMKNLKENPAGHLLQSENSLEGRYNNNNNIVNNSSGGCKSMEETLSEVEKHLSDKRQQSGRPEALDELSRDELLEEKVAVQKALLYLEGVFGRPVARGDRDLVRPLYDRYRLLKRMVVRSGASKLKDSVSELATILEHETMDFVGVASPVPSLATAETQEDPDDSPQSMWGNLHALPLSELLEQQRTTREEKKRLRRSLREFEEDFQRRTGRKLQREDRLPMEGSYGAYKQAKARLRLLEALVTKHK